MAAAKRSSAEILFAARAAVSAGAEPDWRALAEEISTLGDKNQRGLEQLKLVQSVHRARTALSRRPAFGPAPAPPQLRAALRTRPTISANMDVRRGEGFSLVWDRAPRIASWEVRLSERPDPRGDYVVRETLRLPEAGERVEVPIGQHPVRVHLLGRSRDGRLLRRAVISGLTSDNWNDRWQRKASAS
jgi:hypothetical protein